MGLKQTADFTDSATGIVLDAAYMSFGSSQVTILPDASGTYTVGGAAGIWKDKESRKQQRAPLLWKDVAVKATPDEIQKIGIYGLLYDSLKASMPETEDA